jgi:hypothetical protein
MDFDVAQNSYFETYMTVYLIGMALLLEWGKYLVQYIVFNCEGHMFCWKKILGSNLSSHVLVFLPAPYQITLVDILLQNRSVVIIGMEERILKLT